MPDHDHDLIAALAEGRLDPERAAEAEQAITADPAAAALLAAHRRALGAIAAAPRPALTEAEQADLRTSVAEALGLDLSPAPAQRRRAPWAAISVAAATLAALVAVVPLTGLLSNSGDTNAVTAPQFDDADRSGGDTAEIGEVPATSAFSTETAAEADGIEVSTTVAAETIPAAAADPATLEEQLVMLLAEPQDPEQSRLAPTPETACGSEAAEHIGTPLENLLFAELTLSERQAMVFFTVTEGRPEMAAAFAADGCELLESLP
jgi:anti-sigma factor RsiW